MRSPRGNGPSGGYSTQRSFSSRRCCRSYSGTSRKALEDAGANRAPVRRRGHQPLRRAGYRDLTGPDVAREPRDRERVAAPCRRQRDPQRVPCRRGQRTLAAARRTERIRDRTRLDIEGLPERPTRARHLVSGLLRAEPGQARMGRGVRDEFDATGLPAAHVAPRQVRESAAAVGDIPTVQAAGIVGDDRADGGEANSCQRRESVLSEAAIGVIERDDQLAAPERALAVDAALDFVERQRPPAAGGQALELLSKTPGRQARHAQVSPAVDLVIAQDRRNDHYDKKPRASS